MNVRRLISLAAFVALVCGCGNNGHTLRLQPKQGDKFNYTITSKVGSQSSSANISMECVKVEGDKVTLATSANGMKVISVADRTGKVLDTKLEGAPPGTPVPQSNNVAFPEKPVKVGDTWEGNTKMGGTDVKAKYKLVKVEGNNATVEVTMEGIPAGVTMDGPIINVIDLSNGMTVSATTKMKVKGANGQEMSVLTEMKRG